MIDIQNIQRPPTVLKKNLIKKWVKCSWNSTQCYVAAWMGGEFGGKWIHVYVWLNPVSVHPKLSHC